MDTGSDNLHETLPSVTGSYYFVCQQLTQDYLLDKFAIKGLNGEETVGHLPRDYSRIAWYFFACGGLITVEVTAVVDAANRFAGERKLCAVRPFPIGEKRSYTTA